MSAGKSGPRRSVRGAAGWLSAPGGGPGSQGQAGELCVAADRLALRAGGGVFQADTGRQPEPAGLADRRPAPRVLPVLTAKVATT